MKQADLKSSRRHIKPLLTVNDVIAAIMRLDKSDTQRKRRNALVAFKRAMRATTKETLATYRPIRKDGTEVPLKKKRGAFCPYCKVPFASARNLVSHLCHDHGWISNRCPCGFSRPISIAAGSGKQSRTALVMHVAAVGDLAVHLAKAELLAVAKERRAAEA